MAGSPGSKYYDKFLKYTVSIVNTDGAVVLDDENFQLLLAIRETHSLVDAAKKLTMSYRKAWGKLKALEMQLGFALLVSSRGGQHGGKTELSEDGVLLIRAYEELNANFNDEVKKLTKDFFRKINKDF
jgi:molybdate transport repressor ModE-like protein